MKQKIEKPDVYCQNCRAPNKLRESFCVKCGTRLMIVVFPESLQYDTNAVPSYYEDHLLERVSLLEIRLTQVMDRLENAYEFIERGFEAFKKDRLILQSFLETVHELNPELAAKISSRSLEIFDDKSERKNKKKKSDIFDEILANHGNPNNEIFTGLMREGVKLLAKNEEKEAFQMLERAALLSPQNVPLYIFNSIKFYRAEKIAEAKKYLFRAGQIQPDNPKIKLFLAALETDEGAISKAKKLLKDFDENAGNFELVKLIKIFAEAAQENWKKAAEYLEQLYKIKQSAEIAYLLGCVCFQLGKDNKALKYLEKSVLEDAEFSDAWLMQSVIYKKQGNRELEKFAFEKALQGRQNGSQSIEYLKGRKSLEIETALPFEHLKGKKNAVISGGSLRIANFFRQILINSIEE